MHSYRLMYTATEHNVLLRELNGEDELLSGNTGSMAVISLLNRLMVSDTETEQPVAAEKLAVADRDYLLSRVYKNAYGPRIDSTMHCEACTAKFDLSFELDELINQKILDPIPFSLNDEGYYSYNEKIKFRLPTGEDEIAVRGLDVEEAEASIVQRCIPGTISDQEKNEIQQLMEHAAPFFWTNLTTVCPECGHKQAMLFDMQSFLMARMRQERKKVTAEVHFIASSYHWSHQEILHLPRSLRKTYSRLTGYPS